jgi:hypothetical protein
MVPRSYVDYFAASSTAGGALIGLLFVAISLRSESIFGDKSRQAGEALAVTAFTGLANSFFVSLLALIPQTNLGYAATVMAVISIVGTVRLNARLPHASGHLFTLAITLATYLYQLVAALLLILSPDDGGQVIALAYLMFGSMAVALRRAWQLLKGDHLQSDPLGGGLLRRHGLG